MSSSKREILELKQDGDVIIALVQGDSDTCYMIQIEGSNCRCTCQYYMFNKVPCKHIELVLEKVMNQ